MESRGLLLVACHSLTDPCTRSRSLTGSSLFRFDVHPKHDSKPARLFFNSDLSSQVAFRRKGEKKVLTLKPYDLTTVEYVN
ncbi:hypothetical protein LY78DRAFT_650395 [Colletotrichum sublineola]|nr:hypothetical protein LY78DRAFT_650395 [Colletotrichum sublineola]